MKSRVTQLTVAPEGERIFSEAATVIEIADEAGGEFVEIRCHLEGYGKIAINPNEWPAVREAIDEMIKECRS